MDKIQVQELGPIMMDNHRLQQKSLVGFVHYQSCTKTMIMENRLLQSILITENRFEHVLNQEKWTDRDWVQFDRKPESSTRRITQSAACISNVCIEDNNCILKVWVWIQQQIKIVSMEHRNKTSHIKLHKTKCIVGNII